MSQMMNNLIMYVLAISNKDPDGIIVDQSRIEECYEEHGVLMESSELNVTFSNGVILKRIIELEQTNVETEMTCKECWISYEVVFEPTHVDIHPKKKQFINQCQESFWLKMNANMQKNETTMQ